MDIKSLVYGSAYKLRDDKRFLIDDDYFDWDMKFRSLKRYELGKIRLGEIKTRCGNVYSGLTEYAPYKYLEGDKDGYDKFCKVHDKTIKGFEQLVQQMETTGYNPKYVIILGFDDAILDGMHRSSYLLYKFGADFEVPVLRVEFKKRNFWQRLMHSYVKKQRRKKFNREIKNAPVARATGNL